MLFSASERIVTRAKGAVVGQRVGSVSTHGLMTIRLYRGSLRSVDLAIRRTDFALPCLFGAVATAEILVQGYRPFGTALGTFWLGSLVLVARGRFPLSMPL